MGMDTVYASIAMFVDMELCKHCRDDVDVDDMLFALYTSYITDIVKYAYVYKHGMADGTIQTIFKTTKHYK